MDSVAYGIHSSDSVYTGRMSRRMRSPQLHARLAGDGSGAQIPVDKGARNRDSDSDEKRGVYKRPSTRSSGCTQSGERRSLKARTPSLASESVRLVVIPMRSYRPR